MPDETTTLTDRDLLERRGRIIRERELFTEQQACEFFGLSPVTLWRERKAGRLSFRRCGGSIRYTYEDLCEYLDRNLQAAG